MMAEDFFDNCHSNDSRFDRLVDGELFPDEYRRLLESLDDEPEGWRQCALAFLEAQAFRHDLHEVTVVPSIASSLSLDKTVTQTGGVMRHSSGFLLAVVTSLMLAVGLGILVPGWWPASNTIGPHDAVEIVGHQHGLHTSSNPHRHQMPSLVSTFSSDSHKSVQLAMPVGETLSSYNESLEAAENEPLSGPHSIVPERIIRAFRHFGHDVRRHQHYVPVKLRDGRQWILPVEDIDIVPVSQESFQ